jgi:hypothetical protein
MAYVDGFVAAVPTTNREIYKKHAEAAAVVFKEHGALKFVECWGDDVPEGKFTSFPMAVKRPWDSRLLLDRDMAGWICNVRFTPESEQPAVLARGGRRLNTPFSWRHPSNNSPFPITLAATPRYLSPEPGWNISSHACGSFLPLLWRVLSRQR